MRRPPAPATGIVGRERETDTICELLAGDDVRMVTLVGPGGVGKTRLALAVAHAMERSYPDNVCWVELASISRAGDVATLLTRALGVLPVAPETTHEALQRFLSQRRLLLVIDNFEHVLDASGLLADLLVGCRHLTALVTSREALGLGAEHRVEVEPLTLPEAPAHVSLAEVQSVAATQLFLAAARRHDSGFALAAGQAPRLAQLCVRLDGLPLALELAAARVELLGIEELAAELDLALAGAGRTARDTAGRHRTLSATMEWSHTLLDEAERAAFAAFAVFAGGAALDAAQEVTGADRGVLHGLVAKSVLRRRAGRDGATRLVMLETVRQYAEARLEERPERDAIHRRHFDLYERLAISATGRLNGAGGADALAILDGELDNLGAAVRWAVVSAPAEALRLAGHLGPYWSIRADPTGREHLDAALAAVGGAGEAQPRARVLLWRAVIRGSHHEHTAAREDCERAATLFDEAGDDAGLALAYRTLAYLASSLGEPLDVERRLAESAYRHARRTGDAVLIGATLGKLAETSPHGERERHLAQAQEVLARVGSDREIVRLNVNASYQALLEDRPAEAIAYGTIARAAAERESDIVHMMLAMGNIGIAHLFLGKVAPAREAFAHQLRLCVGQAFRFGADEGLAGLAAVAAAQGRPERAAELVGASAAMGYPLPLDQPVYDRLQRGYLAPARAAYGESAWRRAEDAGRKLSYEAAIHAALAPYPAEPPPPLTPCGGGPEGESSGVSSG
jgi:predicted ATPase